MPVKIFTDGAATPRNPGHGGAASIILFGKDNLIANGKYVGYRITSNQAELEAIKKALDSYIDEIGDLEEEIIVYSDSNYSLSVIAGEYKAKKNIYLVKSIQENLKLLKNIKLFWIRSHRQLKKSQDAKTREIILWNSYADLIASKSSVQGPGYDYSVRMGVKEFQEKFTKIES